MEDIKEALEENMEEQYEDERLVSIPWRNVKKAVWYLNNTNYYIYDDYNAKENLVKYTPIECSNQYRSSKKCFNELISERLNGGWEVLGLFYECEKKEDIRNRKSKLCFNACITSDEIDYCVVNPQLQYDKLCCLLGLQTNSVGSLLKIGYILCDLIPRTLQGRIKVKFQLEREKELIWDMIANLADEKNILGKIENQSFDMIKLISQSKVLDDIYKYNVADIKNEKMLERLKLEQVVMRETFKKCLSDIEERWVTFKKDFNI